MKTQVTLSLIIGFFLNLQGMAYQETEIDQFVCKKLDELGIPASDICSDAVFVRRVYLDVIGTLPTQEEAQDFLNCPDKNKRAVLIDTLLDRDEFADYWSLKWCDILRVKAEFPSKLWPNAVQAYHRWIRTALSNNMPYDQFAREMLTASGSNFREAPVNFYRAMPDKEPQEIARIVALTFMGMRTDKWEPERQLGMAAIFGQIGYKKTSEWKEEIVFFDPSIAFTHPTTKEIVTSVFPDGTPCPTPPNIDPRVTFSAWLLKSDVFSENIVNRIWYWLMGRGIIHEPDDIRADNPPQNSELLHYLSNELVTHQYDLKHIYRLILNSATYQRSSINNEGNLNDQTNFSHYMIRRLGAEVLIDAICQITQTTESYSSAIPEPFTWIPTKQRSILLADGSITSAFLDLYGRPPRDSGYESERNNIPSSAQKLHLLNSTHIQQKIANNMALCGIIRSDTDKNKKGKINYKRARFLSSQVMIENMYLTILSRYPSEKEVDIALAYIKESQLTRRESAMDLIWALLNTKEFIYKH